ncbi:hypothetical protein BJ138DRAFT_1071271 [Hygrophoropsis aurantiaca]|uniref:Uncharacterized protein n=1 Tax=Hygrophoropsis aurantiaca TaxID=72124 RepID=A0ACB8A0L9_9AGAM|nr:hypothetical protein BJ138DRAFT_1071271 [Hygrophoropsis aurantiaca]
MSAAEKNELENAHELDAEKDADTEREKDKNHKSSKSSSKSKDLSHVPCKFFKVGSCTAGASCPFSHAAQEPGHQKEVCAWFVKGNCKFGHKCALAHVLPGQPMAMDRKNKKAAQLAAGGGSGNQGRESSRGSKNPKRENQGQAGQNGGSSTSNTRTSLLSGSTAPTRILNTSSRPMPLKATLSPSAPAPPLKNTDFAAFGLPDESNQLPSAPAQGKVSTQITSESSSLEDPPVEPAKNDVTPEDGPPPLPVSTPSAPRRVGLSHRTSDSADLGPIGSPPRSVPTRGVQLNGTSPGTSPAAAQIISSPFSAPGSHPNFGHYDNDSLPDFKTRSGLAASLGATQTWKTDFGPIPSQVVNRGENGLGISGLERNIVVEDEDLEEFIPSSLTDLLTPEERSRRMSRTNSGRPVLANTPSFGDSPSSRTQPEGPHHRYSRSVPAQSLLGDIRSIWSDHANGLPGSPDNVSALGGNGFGLGGTPSSHKSNNGFGGRSFTNEDVPSPSLLAPSNASAAFLPGLHQYYLNAKMSGIQRSASGLNRTSPLHHTSSTSGAASPLNAPTNPALTSTTSAAISFSPPRASNFGNHHLAEPYYPLGLHRSTSGRPIPGGTEADERPTAISPSMRALQAHAPGQSLPQGLAAGYSRIHALPPSMASPSSSSNTASHNQNTLSSFTLGPPSDWSHGLGQGQNQHDSPLGAGGVGLETMFSRQSYSAAASRPSPSPSTNFAHSPSTGMPLPRSVSNNRNWQGQGPLSPLSGPVVTGDDDDDDLFRMDG